MGAINTGIFIDTEFYLGLIHKMDEHHDRSIELLNDLKKGLHGQLYTSNHVMDESATLAAARSLKNQTVMERVFSYFFGELQIASILYLDIDEEKKVWDLFLKMNKSIKDKSDIVSFTDCTNIYCCQNYHIDKILSYDAHFDGWIDRIY